MKPQLKTLVAEQDVIEGKVHAIEARIMAIIVVGGLAGFIVALLLVWVISGSITKPVQLIKQSIERVAEGDLTEEVKVSSSDEIGAMGIALNRTIDSLQEILRHVNVTSERLASSSEELSASTGRDGRFNSTGGWYGEHVCRFSSVYQ